MKIFSNFIIENYEPVKMTDGSHIYSHTIGKHTVQTHFYPRVKNNKNIGYDLHFYRKSSGNGNSDPTSRRGMSSISSSDRTALMSHVVRSIHHFIKNTKPSALHATGNSKKKSETFHNLFNHIAQKTGGIVNRSGSNTSSLIYKKD